MGTWGTGPFDNLRLRTSPAIWMMRRRASARRMSGESWPVPSVPAGTWMWHKRLWPLRP